MQWVVQIQFINRNTLLRWLCEDLNILQNQEAGTNYWEMTMNYQAYQLKKINIKSFKCQGSWFARSVFQSLNDGQKKCIFLIDEV